MVKNSDTNKDESMESIYGALLRLEERAVQLEARTVQLQERNFQLEERNAQLQERNFQLLCMLNEKIK